MLFDAGLSLFDAGLMLFDAGLRLFFDADLRLFFDAGLRLAASVVAGSVLFVNPSVSSTPRFLTCSHSFRPSPNAHLIYSLC